MQIEILTSEELYRFKSELIEEIKQTIKTDEKVTNKEFLRSSGGKEAIEDFIWHFAELSNQGDTSL